jgi:NADH-quinone oxidoreductase subunit M
MAELSAPILTICIALPLAGALAAGHSRARAIAIGVLGIAMLLLLEVLRQVMAGGPALAEPWSLPLFADRLNAVPMVLFCGLALVTAIAAPRRDMNSAFLVKLLTMTSAILAGFAAANLLVFLAAWIVPIIPFLSRPKGENGGRMPAVVLGASVVLLAMAVILVAIEGLGTGVAPLSITGHPMAGGPWAFGLILAAVILRERLFPFHRATVALFSGGPISLALLMVNSQLGLFLIARVAMPLFPDMGPGVLPWLGGLALFTALYTAVLGIMDREPRRLLAMLIASQSSALLAGMATASHEGIAGALVQWIVLGVSSTVLIAVYRSLEVRIDLPLGGHGFMGLGSRLPRLAVFFAISGLTMVGLPGTLGFAGEDLLLHGVLARYSWWGAALPIAIALNAYHAFRLFAKLFLGKDTVTRNTVADALPRERWALTACLAFLVWGGLLPSRVISVQAPATNALVQNPESGPARHP